MIRTDHKPLKYLFFAEMKNRKNQMWAIKISAYNCSIEYLEGKKNTRADMLSRLPVSQVDENMPEVGMFNSNVVATRDAKSDIADIADLSDVKTDDESALMLPDMEKEQRDDPQLQSLIRDMESGSATKGSLKRYIMMDKLLYYCVEGAEIQVRLMVPKKYQDMVLQQFHESCAHWGPDKTCKLITNTYHWVGLYRDVLSHIDKCVPCKERMLKQHSTPLLGMDEVAYPAYRVGVSDNTQYAPFFLLYTRDPVLPIDNLLRPRRKYLGDQHHQLWSVNMRPSSR